MYRLKKHNAKQKQQTCKTKSENAKRDRKMQIKLPQQYTNAKKKQEMHKNEMQTNPKMEKLIPTCKTTFQT